MVFTNKNEMIMNCSCGCGEGISLKVDQWNDEKEAYLSIVTSKWYSEQDARFFISS